MQLKKIEIIVHPNGGGGGGEHGSGCCGVGDCRDCSGENGGVGEGGCSQQGADEQGGGIKCFGGGGLMGLG